MGILGQVVSSSSCWSCIQVRAAFLEEVRLAAQFLSETGLFSIGIATAISGHISRSLLSSPSLLEDGNLSEQSMLMDHARLLDVEPLQVLLHFLWVQLGIRWMYLPPVLKTGEITSVRLCTRPACLPLQTWPLKFQVAKYQVCVPSQQQSVHHQLYRIPVLTVSLSVCV